MKLLILLLFPVITWGQYFNVDYAYAENKDNHFNDYSISWGKIWKGGFGLGTGMSVSGPRSPIFAEATYRPNRRKYEPYFNLRGGVDWKVKFYGQFRVGYQLNIKQSSVGLFTHITQRWDYKDTQDFLFLYGIGINYRISEYY